MSLRVLLEAAGTHSFDLNHLQREGACDLIANLLTEAGYKDGRFKWRLRVDKKCNGSSHTSPINVMGRKDWCVKLKIKPGDNNTSHQCSLLIPDGFSKGFSAELETKLRSVEKKVIEHWRYGKPVSNELVTVVTANGHGVVMSEEEEPKTMVVNETGDAHGFILQPPPSPLEEMMEEEEGGKEAVEEEAEEEEVREEDQEGKKVEVEQVKNLRNYLRHPENIRKVLFAVYGMQNQPFQDRIHYIDTLRRTMGWEHLNRHNSGAVIAKLVRSDYLLALFRGKSIVNYTVTPAGLNLITDLVQKTIKPPLPPVINPNKVLRSLGEVGKWFNKVSARLTEIDLEKSLHQARIVELEKEEDTICAAIDNPKVKNILADLAEATENSLLDIKK